MIKIIGRIILFFALIQLTPSCSEYNKIVKDDDYDKKLMKAEELYNSGSYNRALVLYEQVYQRHPRDDKGETSYYKLGMTYYNLEDYYMSAYYLSNFVGKFPRSKRVEDAMYYSALSSVRNSPSPSLDQEDTEKAINDLQYFISRYPNSRRVDTCNQMMDDLRAKLEKKALLSVELYDRMQKYQAAVTAAESFLEEYPQTEHRLRIVMLMLENQSVLAEKSVFSKRKERLEKIMEIYEKHREELQMSKHFAKAVKISEDAGESLEEVDEIVTFEEIQNLYKLSQQASKAKKIEYLEETLKLYYTFVQRYPRSSYLGRAEEIFNRAERERQNTYSY